MQSRGPIPPPKWLSAAHAEYLADRVASAPPRRIRRYRDYAAVDSNEQAVVSRLAKRLGLPWSGHLQLLDWHLGALQRAAHSAAPSVVPIPGQPWPGMTTSRPRTRVGMLLIGVKPWIENRRVEMTAARLRWTGGR